MPDVRNKDRKNRLSAALRENLKRRKQQAKGRARGCGTETAEGETRPAEEGGEGAGRGKDAPEKPG
jgi:hypothetical protein